MQEIYLAGGCFWGLEAYFKGLPGVLVTEVGYVNGKSERTTYEELKATDHAEALKVLYDEKIISLEEVLEHFFRVIDPTSKNKQGNDVGRQYRTGIYYWKKTDLPVIEAELELLQGIYEKKIQIEVERLEHFIPAEEAHQDYLDKHPNGYCHIPRGLEKEPLISLRDYHREKKEDLKEKLSPLSYAVTQEGETERPFENEMWKSAKKGIYVDIATGEVLFSSKDKFDSNCGWPSFSKPMAKEVLRYYEDRTHGMQRIEVKSRIGSSHLGHVFDDGPREAGGLRYCINAAALRFIPIEKMEEEGYGKYLPFVK